MILSEQRFRELYPNASEDTVRRNFPNGKPKAGWVSAQGLGQARAKVVQQIVAEAQPAPQPTPKKRLRQDTKGLNKTEAEFLLWLRNHYDPVVVLSQAVTLRLGNGVRYTPDFVVPVPRVPVDGKHVELAAYETKGFMRDDANVKLKVAASLYPFIKFHLVSKRTKKNGGGFSIEEVLP